MALLGQCAHHNNVLTLYMVWDIINSRCLVIFLHNTEPSHTHNPHIYLLSSAHLFSISFSDYQRSIIFLHKILPNVWDSLFISDHIFWIFLSSSLILTSSILHPQIWGEYPPLILQGIYPPCLTRPRTPCPRCPSRGWLTSGRRWRWSCCGGTTWTVHSGQYSVNINLNSAQWAI